MTEDLETTRLTSTDTLHQLLFDILTVWGTGTLLWGVVDDHPLIVAVVMVQAVLVRRSFAFEHDEGGEQYIAVKDGSFVSRLHEHVIVVLVSGLLYVLAHWALAWAGVRWLGPIAVTDLVAWMLAMTLWNQFMIPRWGEDAASSSRQKRCGGKTGPR